MGKIYSCRYLNYGGLALAPHAFLHCCISNYHDGEWLGYAQICKASAENADISAEELVDLMFKSKLELIHNINNGIKCDCTGCYQLEYKEWEPITREDFKIHRVGITSDFTCNADCTYCGQDHTLKAPYDTYTLIKKLLDANYIKKNDIYWLNWGGGEPTILRNFDEMYALLIEGSKYNTMHTSAIRYSDTIAHYLSIKDNTNLVVSLDSGTPETYKKIKKVDQYDKVVQNIKKYYDASMNKSKVAIKYILMDKTNTSFDEIDSFFEMIADNSMIGATIYVSLNISDPNMSDDVIKAILYFNARCINVMGKSPIEHGDLISQRAPFAFSRIAKY